MAEEGEGRKAERVKNDRNGEDVRASIRRARSLANAAATRLRSASVDGLLAGGGIGDGQISVTLIAANCCSTGPNTCFIKS